MKRIIVGLSGLALAVLLFAGGAYAYANEWLSFTGNDQIDNSDSHVAEIMDILRATNEGKLSAEEAVTKLEAQVKELEDMNPSGLAKQNKELREKVKQLEDEIEQLKTDNAVLVTDNNAKQKEINDKQSQIESLQNERDGLQTQIDELQTIIDNFDDNSDYVQHLEEQLSIANQKVSEHHETTESAVNEAREIGGESNNE